MFHPSSERNFGLGTFLTNIVRYFYNKKGKSCTFGNLPQEPGSSVPRFLGLCLVKIDIT